MPTRHLAAGAALAAVGLLTLAGPASAHVSPSESSAPADSYFKFDLRVPHGCEDAATSKVEVQIPEGIYSVTPQVVAGWTIEKTIETLAEPVTGPHGEEITERTSVVTWTGGPLDAHQLEEFGLSVRLPDAPGETLYFPTIQTCVDGATEAWIQIPEEVGEEPDSPAPAIELTASSGDDHGGAGDDAASTEDAAPASSTQDDDGGDGLAIAALVVGALGLGTGGLALARGKRTG